MGAGVRVCAYLRACLDACVHESGWEGRGGQKCSHRGIPSATVCACARAAHTSGMQSPAFRGCFEATICWCHDVQAGLLIYAVLGMQAHKAPGQLLHQQGSMPDVAKAYEWCVDGAPCVSCMQVTCEFSVNGNGIAIRMPPNGNIAPPGNYMLFAGQSSLYLILRWVSLLRAGMTVHVHMHARTSGSARVAPSRYAYLHASAFECGAQASSSR